MERKILFIPIFILIFGILITAGLIILFNQNTEKQPQVCFKNNCFNVELAESSEERTRGLMFREYLDADGGMLFIFEEQGIYPFWMKNTLIPLDIIWINEEKEIVFISENTQPCKESPCPLINPGQNAMYVLEINGNISKDIGLRVGDKVNFEINRKFYYKTILPGLVMR